MSKMIQDYILTKVIGEGQFGQVWRAHHKDTGEEFAIKAIALKKVNKVPKMREFLASEIDVLETVEGANLVKYYGKLQTTNNMYLIFEYCEGGTLEDVLIKKGRLQEKEALPIFKMMVDAFHILNVQHIMHRDLKPSNILFDGEGILKIADFGFCKRLKGKYEMTKSIVGSPIYMAPELLQGRYYGTKADIWSLGVVLYELIFGKCPYEENSIPSLLALIKRSPVSFPKEVTKETRKLLKMMLRMNPAERISWSELFGSDLGLGGSEPQGNGGESYPGLGMGQTFQMGSHNQQYQQHKQHSLKEKEQKLKQENTHSPFHISSQIPDNRNGGGHSTLAMATKQKLNTARDANLQPYSQKSPLQIHQQQQQQQQQINYQGYNPTNNTSSNLRTKDLQQQRGHGSEQQSRNLANLSLGGARTGLKSKNPPPPQNTLTNLNSIGEFSSPNTNLTTSNNTNINTSSPFQHTTPNNTSGISNNMNTAGVLSPTIISSKNKPLIPLQQYQQYQPSSKFGSFKSPPDQHNSSLLRTQSGIDPALRNLKPKFPTSNNQPLTAPGSGSIQTRKRLNSFELRGEAIKNGSSKLTKQILNKKSFGEINPSKNYLGSSKTMDFDSDKNSQKFNSNSPNTSMLRMERMDTNNSNNSDKSNGNFEVVLKPSGFGIADRLIKDKLELGKVADLDDMLVKKSNFGVNSGSNGGGNNGFSGSIGSPQRYEGGVGYPNLKPVSNLSSKHSPNLKNRILNNIKNEQKKVATLKGKEVALLQRMADILKKDDVSFPLQTLELVWESCQLKDSHECQQILQNRMASQYLCQLARDLTSVDFSGLPCEKYESLKNLELKKILWTILLFKKSRRYMLTAKIKASYADRSALSEYLLDNEILSSCVRRESEMFDELFNLFLKETSQAGVLAEQVGELSLITESQKPFDFEPTIFNQIFNDLIDVFNELDFQMLITNKLMDAVNMGEFFLKVSDPMDKAMPYSEWQGKQQSTNLKNLLFAKIEILRKKDEGSEAMGSRTMGDDNVSKVSTIPE